jgi:hypothetical protein
MSYVDEERDIIVGLLPVKTLTIIIIGITIFIAGHET